MIIIVLFALVITTIAIAQTLPPGISEMIVSEEPVIGTVLPVNTTTVLAALYYPNHEIWILTYMNWVKENQWWFSTRDIVSIYREKEGIATPIWERMPPV